MTNEPPQLLGPFSSLSLLGIALCSFPSGWAASLSLRPLLYLYLPNSGQLSRDYMPEHLQESCVLLPPCARLSFLVQPRSPRCCHFCGIPWGCCANHWPLVCAVLCSAFLLLLWEGSISLLPADRCVTPVWIPRPYTHTRTHLRHHRSLQLFHAGLDSVISFLQSIQ